MTNNQQFAIVPVPAHPGYAKDFVNSDAILIGPMDEAMQSIRQSVAHTAMLRRIDEGERQAAATGRQQEQNRKQQILTFCDSVAKLSRRMDHYEAELAIKQQRAADKKATADEETTRQRIEAALDDLHSHENTGDLSPLHPKEEQQTDDEEGDLPRELEEGAPAPSGNFAQPEDPASPHDPKQAPQPTSVSFW
jgi:hypothetical protein